MIEEEHKRIEPELEELRAQLKGLRVYIYAGDSYAHNLGSLVSDLGVEIAGMTTLHHDMRVDGENAEHSTLQEMIDVAGDVEVTVCNKQPYEVLKQLRKVNPDFLIVRHMNMTILAGKLGIPSIFEGEINVSAGYDGLLLTGRRILDLLKAKRLLGTLAEYNEFPYTEWWLEQEADYL
ncbi:MAG: nitrogenase, partial [Lachnospiraceae bacterium]|nr:nitrogenase [Lachnospiraceae bacterium]